MRKTDKEMIKKDDAYRKTIIARYHELFPETEGIVEPIKERIVEKIVEVIDPDIVDENELLKIKVSELTVDLDAKENEFLSKIEASAKENEFLSKIEASLKKENEVLKKLNEKLKKLNELD